MYRQAILLVAAALLAIVSGHNINAIVKNGGTYLAFDGFPFLSWPDSYTAHAWAVSDSGALTNVYKMQHPNTSAILDSSRIHNNVLYQFHGAYGLGYLATYALPFSGNVITPTEQVQLDNQVQEIPATFDFTDNIAVVLVSRYLTVVTLSPLQVRHNILAIPGTGSTPGGIVYNHNTNEIFYFETDYCEWGYCQHIYPYYYNDTTFKISSRDETFKPAWKNNFNKGQLSGCELDYGTEAIYCINHAIDAIFTFPLSNLNDHTRINLPSYNYVKGNVAWDFTNMIAYLVSTDTTTNFFQVTSINLNNGDVILHKEIQETKVVSVSLHGQTLALGHAFDEVRSMSLVDVSTFASTHVNLTLTL